MKKAVLGLIISAGLCGFSMIVGASQGLSISDQILGDYRKAATFRQFVEKLTQGTFPGEAQFVQKVWKTYPELLKDAALPKLIFENKQYVLREGPSEIRLQAVEKERYQFLINGQNVTFNLYDLPSQKMKKIMEASKSRKSAHFVLMPVVWAAGQGQPSKLDVVTQALVNVLMDDQGLPEDQMVWERAEEKRFSGEDNKFLKKKVSEKCLKEIHSLEHVFVRENKLPFSTMKCDGKFLDVSLSGLDSERKMTALKISPGKIAIRRVSGPDAEAGVEVYTFKHNSKDEENLTREAYKDDESVADSSSPFQRDNNFGPATKADEAHIEYLYRYIGVAGNPDVRNFCNSCGGDLNAYTQLVKAVDLRSSRLHKDHKDARDTKSTK